MKLKNAKKKSTGWLLPPSNSTKLVFHNYFAILYLTNLAFSPPSSVLRREYQNNKRWLSTLWSSTRVSKEKFSFSKKKGVRKQLFC